MKAYYTMMLRGKYFRILDLCFAVILCVMLSGLYIGCNSQDEDSKSFVNFGHLRHLTEEIEFSGDTIHIVHIYADYPEYNWVSAAESGPEGISCVDDVARAAVVYLRHYELSGDTYSLDAARPLLKFILNMQLPDGRFYNFIFDDRSVNTDGVTSYPSFGWWAVRGVWALSMGYRIYSDHDPAFAHILRSAVERTFPQIDTVLTTYGSYKTSGSIRVPSWLIYQYDTYSASTVTELLLGLNEYYKAHPNDRVAGYISKFAEGLIALQMGDAFTFPYGAFLSWPGGWHAWANGQTQALAEAGMLLSRSDFILAGEKEVRGWYTRLAAEKMIREFRIDDPRTMQEFSQIAYNLRPMIVGALRVADATGEQKYQKLAGILTSWFFGNNVTGIVMYDVATGRCFDGINNAESVNRNSGAESTIEALYSIIEAEQYADARKYFYVQKHGHHRTNDRLVALFELSQGDYAALIIYTDTGTFDILEGSEADDLRQQIESTGHLIK
jgi:hypothetical protein